MESCQYPYILLSSVLLGLPGMAVGAGLVYWCLGRVDPKVWLWLFVLTMLFELPSNILFAHYWNLRAKKLTRDDPIAPNKT